VADPKIRAVKGSRPSARPKKPSGKTDRIRFVPREGGGVDVFLIETGYAVYIRMPVEVTVPEEAWEYEYLGDR
jgi:hypothetical protein